MLDFTGKTAKARFMPLFGGLSLLSRLRRYERILLVESVVFKREVGHFERKF